MPALVVATRGVYTTIPPNPRDLKFGVSIENAGLGPARLRSITFVDAVTGREYQHPPDFAKVHEIFYQIFSMYGYRDQTFLKEGASIPLFALNDTYMAGLSDEELKGQIKRIQQAFMRTVIRVEYESLLGDIQMATWEPDKQ
jgi:hypothetical protein